MIGCEPCNDITEAHIYLPMHYLPDQLLFTLSTQCQIGLYLGSYHIISVATAIAGVFQKNAISMGNKFTEMLKVFDKIDEMES